MNSIDPPLFRFRLNYFLVFLLLFLVEVCIALFVRDRFVRPYLGDVLVVMLLYCFVRSFLKLKPRVAALGVLLFAFLIEMLQYFRLVEVLGLRDNKIATTVLGSSFDWEDLLAYSLGAVLVLLIEGFRKQRQKE